MLLYLLYGPVDMGILIAEIFCLLILALLSVQGWQLESRKVYAVVSIFSLAVSVLFPIYGESRLAAVPRNLPDRFHVVLKLGTHYDNLDVLLAIVAMVPVVLWRRSSKHLTSGLALGLAISICLFRFWISVVSD